MAIGGHAPLGGGNLLPIHQPVPPANQGGVLANQGGNNAVQQPLGPNPNVVANAGTHLAPRGTTDKLKDFAYRHGAGKSQTTVALTPFRSVTSSAEPKMDSCVRPDGAAGPQHRPVVARALAATPTPAELATARGTPMHSNVMGQLNNPATVTQVIHRRLQGTVADKAALRNLLTGLQATHGLTQAETTQLALALTLGFRQAADATAALTALGQTDLVGQMGNAMATALAPQAPVLSPAQQQAWKLAVTLDSVDFVGLDLLNKVAGRPAGQAQAMTDDQRGTVRAYLRAASMATGHTGGRVDPQAVYRNGPVRQAIQASQAAGSAWPGRSGAATPAGVALRLHEKALLAVPDRLNPPAGVAQHGCDFAIEMIAAGFTTDDVRGRDGRKTNYGKAKTRAIKTFGTHLDRARAQLPLEEQAAVAAKKLATHKGKSSFAPHNKIVSSDGLDKGIEVSHRGELKDGRVMRDYMIDHLALAVRNTGGPGGTALPTAPGSVDPATLADDTLRNMTRHVLLQVFRAQTVMLPRFTRGDAPTQHMLDAARNQLHTMMQAGSVDPAVALRIENALTAQTQEMTPQGLLRWAADAGGPADEAALRGLPDPATPYQGASPQQVDWSRFKQGYLRAAHSEVPPVPVPSLAGRTRPQCKPVLRGLVAGEELGSGFVYSSSGFSHFTTKNVTGTISGVFAGSTGSARVDLGGGRRRAVLVESGVGTDRSYIRVSRATVQVWQAGLGGSAGFDLGLDGAAKLSASVGGDVKYSYEIMDQEGVSFGFPRHLSGGVGGDEALAVDLKQELSDLLVDVSGPNGVSSTGIAIPGNPEDRGCPIKAAYQRWQGKISVNNFTIEQSDHRVSGSLSGGLGVRAGNLGVGIPSARVTGERKSTQMTYKDHTGTLQAHRVYNSVTYKGSADVVMAGFSAVLDHGGTAAAEAASKGVEHSVGGFTGLLAGNLVAASIDGLKCGETHATHRLMHHGKQLPTSFATLTYHNMGSFANAVGSNPAEFHNFAEDMSTKYHGARHAAGAQTSVDIEKQMLADFTSKRLEERDLTANPQKYWEWSRTDEINKIAGQADLMEKLNDRAHGDANSAAQAKQELDELHANPGDRQGRFFVCQKTRFNGVTEGVQGVLGFTHVMDYRASETSLTFV